MCLLNETLKHSYFAIVLLRADEFLDSHAVAFNELLRHRLWMLALK